MRRLITIALILAAFILVGRLVDSPTAWLLPYGPEKQPLVEASSSSPSQIPHQALYTPEVQGGVVQQLLVGTTAASGTTPAPTATAQLFGIVNDNQVSTAVDETTPVPADEPASVDEEPDDPTSADQPSYLVTKIVDGDTIELESGERVRYIGIDTPESTTEHECYGEEAKARNRELVEGQRVTLVADVEDRDKYGRLLRYVWVDETFINLALAEEGFATQLTIPPNVAHADEFRTAVTQAREQGNGLWSGCPIGEQNESSSRSRTDYDETIPQAKTTDCPADKPIKGNAQSMIYHVPGGDFYAKTKPEACFASEADALAAGYRKSKR
ncbi:thermonuclease family protein [Candidatus Berkelbacteria bacterium]|nr:thermonuclease family protein [Candidatus Berkelbacteria bacterium]